MALDLAADPLGLHRVLDGALLPQAARRLDPRPELWPDEVRVRVERLNLDAASLHQLRQAHDDDPDAVRAAVREIIASRGKMQNPVTGSGGMLLGTVEEVGPDSPLGLEVGDRIASLVSLTLTPLVVHDALALWDGRSEQVPCSGHAILFGRSVAAVLPDDLPESLSLAVMDVCGAPALVRRVVTQHRTSYAKDPVVLVLGAAGKSGSLSVAAAREAGAGRVVGLVPTRQEAHQLEQADLCDDVVVADAREPLAVRDAVREATGGQADVTVVCVDVPDCEGGAILATADGGTIVFFSMATSFSAAALGAEGMAADVTMLIGNGFVPGHSDYALHLVRSVPGVRSLFERRHP
ncbi:L-erythro-3,5-diaminohexanoate dehydrogenase [Nocardioides daphniae]|uniref:L-erythro-3,5-diaminohexanoate dehydrogenase n=1 Tax=Nocardioides daphniae TaxID=402297 RepID=A0A4P7UC28_9ACTN|nr:L-erythro-3,5-diaminohexanoate dehydrogenase [Nocardioides daphniae]QCC77304.1 L-erythro-3,5-diaminohexanoate dehydrogenase [Nocardioides daphniae]GGD25471.1 L-erythro-3,5-diaminohexanoate dehydrogenase [Nocardioides daphniae]